MATIENPPNSVWPNGLKVDSEGYVTFYPLGTNKIDINDITWPKGDKIISPFVYQDEKLVGFIDTKALTISENTTIYLPYEHIETEFSTIDKGQLQIHAPKATIKKASWKDSGKEDIPEAQFKYKGCVFVDDVTAVDANYKNNDIVEGVWSEPLWDLENGEYMFNDCVNLTTFNSDLPSLWIGGGMFNNCPLTSFSSDLSSLGSGGGMFYGCKLDASSVKNIIDTINTIKASRLPELMLGMGCDNTTEDKDLFAQEVGYTDMTSLLDALRAKGWSVSAQYNGRPTTTYGLRISVEETLPVFVKLEEVEEVEEEEKHANYTSMDGSKKYKLDWFHETTGSTEGYTQFVSLEEAIEALNIKLIERN